MPIFVQKLLILSNFWAKVRNSKNGLRFFLHQFCG